MLLQITADTFDRYSLLVQGPRSNFADGAFRSGYFMSAGFLSFMLFTYPICWALAEGSNVISPTSEMIWYGILDCITGPFFLAFYLFQLRRVDYTSFGFQSGKYTDTYDRPAPRVAKAAEAAAVPPAPETGAV